MEFSAKDVMELRNKTGAGMMDCKKALTDSAGDMEKAVTILREKGIASAQKKSERETNHGYIAKLTVNDGKLAVMVELDCETDFVSRNPDFQKFALKIAEKVASLDKSALAGFGSDPAIIDLIKEQISIIGENIVLKGYGRWEVSGAGCIEVYIHSGARLASLVELECENDKTSSNPALHELAKNIAMHVAATNPLSLSEADISKDVVEKEKEIYRVQAINEGKKPEFADKIIEGRLKKFYAENCLLDQIYVRDEAHKATITDVVKEQSNTLCEKIVVKQFVRWEVGTDKGSCLGGL